MTATLPKGTAAAVLRRLTPEPERPLPQDPAVWIRDELDEHLWTHQTRVMRSVIEHRYTAWQACHGPGKSFSAARLMAWWIAAHPPGEAIAVSTAPSGQQVRGILWRELARAHNRANLPGKITNGAVPEWQIGGEIVAFGRKPADYTDAAQARAAFQGIHARYVLVVLDEAGGIPEWLWEAVDTLVTNEASRVLAIGNPDDPTTHFAKVCAPGTDWHTLRTSAFDTPAFTGEPIPEQMKESLVSKLWVEERRREWGEESPLYISKVLGEFPEVADDVLVYPKLVREAHERDRSGYATTDAGRFGMDVARHGSDETVIYRNRGGMIRLEDAWRKMDTHESAQRAQRLLERDRYRHMQIDLPGIGGGVFDPLAHAGFNVSAFNGGEAARDADRFVNRRAEAWWSFREGLEAGLIDLDPDDDLLAAQLQAPKWKLDSSQRRIRVETKDEMRARGLKSGDRADAAILSYYEGTRGIGDIDALLKPDPDEPQSITAGLLTMPT